MVATLAVPAESVAAAGLPGTFHTWPSRALPQEQWSVLLRGCVQRRLVGLLLIAMDRGLMAATDDQIGEALEAQTRAMASALLLEDLLLDVAALVEKDGLDLRVIKGCAVGNLDYPQPEMRSYGDVDVLVRSEQVDDVLDTLTKAGLERVFRPPGKGWDSKFGKGALLRTTDGLELDLHRTFCTAPLGLQIDLQDLWEDDEEFTLAGQRLRALPREMRLLNAAYSAVVSDVTPSLVTFRDIAQLALHPQLDGLRVRELALAWGGGAVLATAISETWRALRVGDITGLSAWAQGYRPSPGELRTLALYRESRASETARALATLKVLPRWRDRMQFGLKLAFADDAYAQASSAGRVGRVVRGVRQLRRTRGVGS